MSRSGRPAWPWRLFAWIVFFAGGMMSLPALILTPASGLIYIAIVWVAMGGVLSYAYGHPARPLWFWRLFALLLSFYVMWDLGGYLVRSATLLGTGPGLSATGIATLAIAVPINILVCVALLKHAQLLRGAQRAAIRDLEDVFA